jgi:hypothetical protein
MMDKYKLQNDVKTFGFRVKTFPMGIGEAFDQLVKLFPSDEQRSYYGVGEFGKDGSVLYYALAEERFAGEAEKYGYPVKVIEKGEYLTETIKDWTSKTNCIKDVFAEMMKDNRIGKDKPCVEWYKTMEEMLCMVAIEP